MGNSEQKLEMRRTAPSSLGISLPRLGLGGMRFPMLDDSETIDQAQVNEMVDTAIACGANYFDTAFGYHGGKSETAFRTALSRHPRESYILVDKLPIWACDEPADVERIFLEQLEKCGVDYFDIYLIHAVDSKKAVKIEEFGAYDKLAALKAQGKIKHLGFSYHDTPEFFMEFTARHAFDVVQVQLNYLDWDIQRAKVLYENIEQRGLAAVVMEPVRGGLLARLPEDIAAPFAEAAPARSQASFALRWLDQLPGVSVILSGMSNLAQLQENMETLAVSAPFDEKETAAVEEVRRRLLERFEIPCTGCGYCMECPFGVHIPDVFSRYNTFNLFRDPDKFLTWLDQKSGEGHGPSACQKCGVCVSKCPQFIEIPDRLAYVADKAASLRVAP